MPFKVFIQWPNGDLVKIKLKSNEPLDEIRRKFDLQVDNHDLYYIDDENDKVIIADNEDVLDCHKANQPVVYVRPRFKEPEDSDEKSSGIHLSVPIEELKCVRGHHPKNGLLRCTRCNDNEYFYCNRYEADTNHEGRDHIPELVDISAEMELTKQRQQDVEQALIRYLEYEKNVMYSKGAWALTTVANMAAATGVQGMKTGVTSAALVAAEVTGKELVQSIAINTAATAGIVGGLCVAATACTCFYKYSRGTMSLEEVGFRIGSSVVTNGINVAGTFAGAVSGAAIGTAILPGVGTVVGGIVGGLLTGLFSAYFAKKAGDQLEGWWIRHCNDLTRQDLIRDALKYFRFDIAGVSIDEFLQNEQKFNRTLLRFKYKCAVRMCHPDLGGSSEDFHICQAHYGLLLGVLVGDEEEVQQETVRVLAAIML